MWKDSLKWKIKLLVAICVLLVFLLCIWSWNSYKKHLQLMENIKLATSNPNGLNPGELVNRIDGGFAALPEDERKRILADSKLLADRIEKASYQNFKQAFDYMFMLPEPLRRKLIVKSAEAIRTSIQRNPDKVNAFYGSDAGKAVLRAASNYFMTELDGRQKSELRPITDTFFYIHCARAKQGNN